MEEQKEIVKKTPWEVKTARKLRSDARDEFDRKLRTKGKECKGCFGRKMK